jgi:hypothetical protein
MASRYINRLITRNDNKLYKKILEERNVKYIRQFRSPVLAYPTAEQMRGLQKTGHIWTLGDRFYKLAYEYYGESQYWWVIAWFNKTPTETHVSLGDIVYIPLPLYTILNLFKV